MCVYARLGLTVTDKKEEIFLFLFIFYVALAVWRHLLFRALQK